MGPIMRICYLLHAEGGTYATLKVSALVVFQTVVCPKHLWLRLTGHVREAHGKPMGIPWAPHGDGISNRSSRYVGEKWPICLVRRHENRRAGGRSRHAPLRAFLASASFSLFAQIWVSNWCPFILMQQPSSIERPGKLQSIPWMQSPSFLC